MLFPGEQMNAVSGLTFIKLLPVGRTGPPIPLNVFIVSKIKEATSQSKILS